MDLKAPWIMYPKEEGSPIHPEEITWLCNCAECQKRFDDQLAAWEKYNGVERQK